MSIEIDKPTDQEERTKQQIWDSIVEQMTNTVDGLGLEIDSGIMETVIAFNALGFNTTASCEGHLDHGVASPWIDIQVKDVDKTLVEAEDAARSAGDAIWEELQKESITKAQQERMYAYWETAFKLRKRIERPRLVQQDKVMNLLSEFYSDRSVPYHVQLTMGRLGHGHRIQCQGADVQDIKPEDTRGSNLETYQAEMKAFTDFLKNKFFTG